MTFQQQNIISTGQYEHLDQVQHYADKYRELGELIEMEEKGLVSKDEAAQKAKLIVKQSSSQPPQQQNDLNDSKNRSRIFKS